MTQAEGFIGNDSGTMHLAAIADVPIVSIFGPTTLDLGYRPGRLSQQLFNNH